MTLKIMSGIALRGALEGTVLPAFEAASGIAVDVVWEPTTIIMKALAEGASADIVILTDEAIGKLAAGAVVDRASIRPLADAVLGVAVSAGAARPEIATPAAFRQALLAARSVAYSRAGASGIYFEGLIERLGIAEAIRARATVIPAGFTAHKLASGEADLAVQQISELLMVPEAQIVGPFPAELQSATRFEAAVLTASPRRAETQHLLQTLTSETARNTYRSSGLVPCEPAYKGRTS